MKPKPALDLIPEILAALKAHGPMDSYALAQRFGGTPASIGGKMRIAERAGWCSGETIYRARRYIKRWTWLADRPVDYTPPPIFKRKYTRTSPPESPKERQRKAEINQDHARWFAALQAEQAAKRTQCGNIQGFAAAVLDHREQRA